MLNFLSKYPQYCLGGAAVLLFLSYLFTMAPGVIHLDSGELAAVASSLGIAHPTGYPLFTMSGFVVTKLFFFLSPVAALNLFSAILTAISAYFVLRIIFYVLPGNGKSEYVVPVTIAAGFALGFSKTFWFQSTSVEVYSMHIMLVAATLWRFLIAVDTTVIDKNNVFKQAFSFNWLVFSVLLAFCFSNHLTSVLLLPAIVLMYFRKYKFNKESFLFGFLLVIPFLIVLVAVYSYLPLRAAQNPSINWGNPTDWERIKRHIMGWQYQSWIFSSTESASKQLKYFITGFPAEFTYWGVFFMIGGVISMYRYAQKYFYFMLTLFITCVLYSINYDIVDIDAYFLLAYMVAGIFIAFAFYAIMQWKPKFGAIVLVLFPLVSIAVNYAKVNQRSNVQFEQYTRAMLTSLPQNAVIIGYGWDFYISPSYYLQFVENVRPDIAIIDKELLRRSWYFNQLKTTYPEVYAKISADAEVFIPELLKFERNEAFDPNVLEKQYRRIIYNLVAANWNERPVFFGIEMVGNELNRKEIDMPQGYVLSPDVFLYRISPENKYYPASASDFVIDYKDKKDYYNESLKRFVSGVCIDRAMYELQYNYPDKARFYRNKALKANSKIALPPALESLN